MATNMEEMLEDSVLAKSCITLAATVQRKTITTLEGLKDAEGKLTPIQQAFWDEAGLQCAFCAPGMVLTATELLKGNAEPTDDEIRTAMAGNLCHCTGYQSIVRAVRAAARVMKQLK